MINLTIGELNRIKDRFPACHRVGLEEGVLVASFSGKVSDETRAELTQAMVNHGVSTNELKILENTEPTPTQSVAA